VVAPSFNLTGTAGGSGSMKRFNYAQQSHGHSNTTKKLPDWFNEAPLDLDRFIVEQRQILMLLETNNYTIFSYLYILDTKMQLI